VRSRAQEGLLAAALDEPLKLKVALAGDTMLGRRVAEAISAGRPLVAPEVAAVAAEADLFLLNLECCISDRGKRWPAPNKPFFFRAPPEAAELLADLGVDCVTLANNHALDFGREALEDTLGHLCAAGVACVGAGSDLAGARAPGRLMVAGAPVCVVAFGDHPSDFAATRYREGIAFADLRKDGVPEWLRTAVRESGAAITLVAPHWGPNMAPEPLPYVRKAAHALVDAGATLIAGHSAHVFQGVEGRVLYDLGDFLDDYAVDAELRNDLGLLFLVTVDQQGPHRIEAVPLKLEYCHTRLATRDEAAWIAHRFRSLCLALGTDVSSEDGRLVIRYP
jgi:poly-gamma-glutamate capsule biosynthesis protein CapA/YwtB (metallophosphatase superfamily)